MRVILYKNLHPDLVDEFLSGLAEKGSKVRAPIYGDVWCPVPFGKGSTFRVRSTEYVEIGTDDGVPFGTLYGEIE